MSSDVFARFAPFITEYIYRHGWEGLRPVQTEAAHVIFDTDNNLLLSSGTASGKTEAALFPIISLLSEEELSSFGCLYIAPLKSLINDQFGRIDELLDLSGIPVYHWHGDVAASHKTRALREPRGILQITPESLESMLMNRSNDIPRLFGQLRFVVLYRSEDNRLESFTDSINFGEKIFMDEVEERDTVNLSGDLEDLNISAINSRKLAVRALLGIHAVCEVPVEEEIVSGVENDPDIQQKSRTMQLLALTSAKKDILRVHSDIALPQSEYRTSAL